MKLAAAAALLLVLCSPASAQDRSADETALREAIAMFDAGRGRDVPRTEDIVVWTGSLVKPVIGNEEPQVRPGAAVGRRENVKTSTRILQLHISQAGDMAYEYSTFSAAFDRTDEKRHAAFDGARLRVWRKLDGVWKVAAVFQRPYDNSPTTR